MFSINRVSSILILVILLQVAVLSLAVAQSPLNHKLQPTIANNDPLVIVGNVHTTMRCLVIDPDHIDSINIFRDSNAVKKYGDDAINGVVVIIPKNVVRFLNLEQVIQKYNLPPETGKMAITINGTAILTPQKIVIEESELKGVEFVDPGLLTPDRPERIFNILVSHYSEPR